MSDVIKPEDVTQDILELAMERFQNAYWKDVTKQNVADFLDDCIDAGLVSPPCYTVRDPNSGRLYFDCGQVRLRPGKPQIPAHEHWKGQTK